MPPAASRWWILLSIVAAVATLALKFSAYWLTGSVGLLSDALESIVNLLAAVVATFAVWYAAQPIDATHTYGHEKIEFFASGLEGLLILVAAGGILVYAFERLVTPEPLAKLDVGLLLSLLAAGINGAVGVILIRVGKARQLIVLEADGRHLLTDVWTSIGVLLGLSVVWLTGWFWLDGLVGLCVASIIVWTGVTLVLRSFHGLMDHALPAEEVEAIRTIIRDHLPKGMACHALRTRRAGGARRTADFHLLVPGSMSVADAHRFSDTLEAKLQACFTDLEVVVHLEPIEEHTSWNDHALVGIEPHWHGPRHDVTARNPAAGGNPKGLPAESSQLPTSKADSA